MKFNKLNVKNNMGFWGLGLINRGMATRFINRGGHAQILYCKSGSGARGLIKRGGFTNTNLTLIKNWKTKNTPNNMKPMDKMNASGTVTPLLSPVVVWGPAGVSAVVALRSRGRRVLWVDPEFSAGRLKRYMDVPCNTKVDILVAWWQCRFINLFLSQIESTYKM